MAASLTAMTLDFAPPAKRFSAEERVALVLALAAHVGVAALLVMRPAAPPPAPPRRMEVTLADDVGLQASAPSHAPAAADLTPVLGEAQPEAAKAAPPKPVEKAEAVPVPVPVPVPRHVEKPAPAKSAPAKPAPPKRTHDAVDQVAAALAGSAAAAHKTQKPAGGARIDHDFLKGVTSADSTGKAAASAPMTGAVKSALASAISRQLKPHWVAPQGVDADQLVTVLAFDLGPDGSLAGEPRVVRQDGINDSNQPQAARHAEQAKRAVRLAAPFQLPSEYYAAWKHVNWTFDRKLSQ